MNRYKHYFYLFFLILPSFPVSAQVPEIFSKSSQSQLLHHISEMQRFYKRPSSYFASANAKNYDLYFKDGVTGNLKQALQVLEQIESLLLSEDFSSKILKEEKLALLLKKYETYSLAYTENFNIYVRPKIIAGDSLHSFMLREYERVDAQLAKFHGLLVSKIFIQQVQNR